ALARAVGQRAGLDDGPGEAGVADVAIGGALCGEVLLGAGPVVVLGRGGRGAEARDRNVAGHARLGGGEEGAFDALAVERARGVGLGGTSGEDDGVSASERVFDVGEGRRV